jgi:preprotein translocase subunit SecF
MKSRKRREEADRFADVPAFTEDMPIQEDPNFPVRREAVEEEDGDPGERVSSSAASRPSRPPRYTAGERGSTKPVSPSASSKRDQPSRKSRSQRGKK